MSLTLSKPSSPRSSTRNLTQQQAADILQQVQRERCARSLLYFVRLFWSYVEPGREMVDGWWLHAWCRHLEAITSGEITRLLGNCPPGFMKSLLTNVFWPAWEWGPRARPHLRYVTFAYSQALTERDNVRMQQVVFSPLYRELWGDQFSAIENKIKFANDRTGWKLATSVGGVGTGERGDRIIIDDPNNIKDVESITVRESTNQWLREVMPTRLNDPQRSAIVLIQQRSHEDDASGTLLSQPEGTQWCHVMVPMRFEPARVYPNELGWVDPRDYDGELAWPERFPEDVVTLLEQDMGPYAVAGQFQQSPAPRGGGLIKREWWQVWPPVGREAEWSSVQSLPDGTKTLVTKFPAFGTVIAAFDGALAMQDVERNSYSALTVWAAFAEPDTGRPKIMLKDAWRMRGPLHEVVKRMGETCREHKVDSLLIENKASGAPAASEVRRQYGLRQWSTRLIDVRGDKMGRLRAVEPLFAAGLIYAPDTTWAEQVIEETLQFPRAAHNDYVDTISLGLGWLRRNGVMLTREEHAEDELDRRRFRPQQEALYDV